MGQKYNLSNMKRVTGIVWTQSKGLFIIVFFLSLLTSLLPFVNYIATLLIIDNLASAPDIRLLACYALLAIACNVILLIITGLLRNRKDVCFHKAELEFEKKIRVHLLDMDYATLESNRVEQLKLDIEQTKMRFGGIQTILQAYENITGSLFNILFSIGSLVGIFYLRMESATTSFWSGPIPLALLIALSIFLLIFPFFLQIRTNRKVLQLNDQLNKANGGAMMFMQLMGDYHFGKDIRLYGMKDFLCSKLDHLWSSSIGMNLMKKMGQVRAVVPGIIVVFNMLILVLSYLLAAIKAIEGEITVGSVVLYANSIQIFVEAISALIVAVGKLMENCDLMKPYLTLLEIPGKESGGGKAVDWKQTDEYKISFDHVSFRYPNTEKWAVENINLEFHAGDCVAIVGENGSGKTTLIKLLCRLYEPTQGKILLNGKDISTFDINAYRALISVVFQDFTLMSFALGKNIAAAEEYDKSQLDLALQKAGVDTLFQSLPEKYDTLLYQDYEENGVEVSGGEAQKIAIARAIYKDAPFLVLDEPTSALDPRTEHEIYARLNHLLEGKTVIFISHRLSSCRFCEKILVFHRGKLVQQGSHTKLLQQTQGKYFELWEAQAKFYQ